MSAILVAVAVPPLTVTSTVAWWPALTELMPPRCASTMVELPTAYVCQAQDLTYRQKPGSRT